LKYAGIYGQDGTTWAHSNEVKTSAAEVKDLVAGVKDVSKFQASGIKYNGVKYMFLQVVEGVVVGRKGPNSICSRVSTKAIIVAVTKDGAQPAEAVGAINFLVSDLTKKKF